MTRTTRIIGLLVLAIFCSTTISAWARPPRAHERQCVIETIELSTRAMTLRCAQHADALQLVWTKQTQFVKDWRFTDSAQLKPGQRVTIYYHSPFFGQKFASKIVWQSGRKGQLNLNPQTN